MRWHALARANGQGQVATPNSAVSHVLDDVTDDSSIGISRKIQSRLEFTSSRVRGYVERVQAVPTAFTIPNHPDRSFQPE